MRRVKLGSSDLEVSNICLGCWQFNGGGEDITWAKQEEKVKQFSIIIVNNEK